MTYGISASATRLSELAQRIQAISRDVLNVNAGSLYPALYRLEARHLERTVGRLVARGLTRGEAEKRRAGKFGNVALHEEHGRDARAAHWRALRRGRLPMR